MKKILFFPTFFLIFFATNTQDHQYVVETMKAYSNGINRMLSLFHDYTEKCSKYKPSSDATSMQILEEHKRLLEDNASRFDTKLSQMEKEILAEQEGLKLSSLATVDFEAMGAEIDPEQEIQRSKS